MPTQITTIDHLKKLCTENPVDAYVRLNGGIRSSKSIMHVPNGKMKWSVYNEVDDTECNYSTDEALLKSFVGEAMIKGALYAH